MEANSKLKSFELVPVLGLGVAYYLYGMMPAVATLMVLQTLFVGAAFLLGERLTGLQWMTWVLIVVFGAATLIFNDPLFFKWKPTIINTLFAVVLWGSHWIGERVILERLLDGKFRCPSEVLRRVNAAAGAYFLLVGGLNIYIAFQFTESTWMTFRVAGLFVLNALFLMGCLFYLRDYLKDFLDEQQAAKKD